jgi:hypothetical protein
MRGRPFWAVLASFYMPSLRSVEEQTADQHELTPASGEFALIRDQCFRWRLLRGALFQLLHYGFKVGISGAKAPREPVAAALDESFTIGDHRELPGLSRRDHGLHTQPFLDEVRETRGLGLIARSGRAGTDFNLHAGSPSWRIARNANILPEPAQRRCCPGIPIAKDRCKRSLVFGSWYLATSSARSCGG